MTYFSVDDRDYDSDFGDSDILSDFTDRELKAFVDLAFLVVMADREVTEDELDALGDQLFKLAFESQTQAVELLEEEGAEIRARIEQRLDDPEKVESFIRRRAELITGGAHRETALDILASLAYADDLAPSEQDVCFQIGRAFGFPGEMVTVQLEEASRE
jgi:hypothetical protein